jgi:hypothetical protein
MDNCCNNDPVKFNFDLSKLTEPCPDIENVIKSITFESTDSGKEFIVEVEGLMPRIYDLGEIEVVKNDGAEIILKGNNFEVSIDLTDQENAGAFLNMKAGDKFTGYASHE